MNKGLMLFCITLGSIVGTYIPALWHAGVFSGWSIMLGLVGALAGIWAAVKLNAYLDI